MSLQSEPKSFKMIIFAILLQICSVISLDGVHLHFNKREADYTLDDSFWNEESPVGNLSNLSGDYLGEVERLLKEYRQNQELVRKIGGNFYQIIYPVQLRHHEKMGISTREVGGSKGANSGYGSGRGRTRTGKHFHRTSLLIKAFNHKFRLDLELNTQLLAPNIQQKHILPSGYPQDSHREIEHCYYHGTVKDYPGATAAFHTCNGVSGVIHVGNETFVIHPFYGGDLSKHPHVIFEARTKQNKGCANSGNLEWRIPRRQQHFTGFMDKPDRNGAGRFKRDVRDATKYIETAIIIDKAMFDKRNGSTRAEVVHDAIQVANIADLYFRTLNTRVSVVYIETWQGQNQAQIDGSKDISKAVSNFNDYTTRKLHSIDKDTTQLLTGEMFVGGEAGMSVPETVCTPKAVGISVDINTYEPHLLAGTMAHMIGHNIGMGHDDNRDECYCRDWHGCIMAQSIIGLENVQPYKFSECSRSDYIDALRIGHGLCLLNKPNEVGLGSRRNCGNGLIEDGEECDCGSFDDCSKRDPCCDPITCKLVKEAECASGPCCENCQLKSPGSICRDAHNECDLPEMCTGESGQCPVDVYKKNGSPCGATNIEKASGYCFNGMCPTLGVQCEKIWGYGGGAAEKQCYEQFNSKGSMNGHCGMDQTGRYIKCEPENVQCGSLQCKDGNSNPEIEGMDQLYSRTIISIRGVEYECKSTSGTVNESEFPEHGLVRDGTPCGENLVCVNQTCVSIFPYIDTSKCPVSHNNQECSGNGVCTNTNKCHCDFGWAGTDCSTALAVTTTVASATNPVTDSGVIKMERKETPYDTNNTDKFSTLSMVLTLVVVVFLFFIFFTCMAVCYRRKTTRLKYDPPYAKKPMAKYVASNSNANHHTIEEMSLDPTNKYNNQMFNNQNQFGTQKLQIRRMTGTGTEEEPMHSGANAVSDVEHTLKTLNGYHEDILEALKNAVQQRSSGNTPSGSISEEILRKTLQECAAGTLGYGRGSSRNSSRENICENNTQLNPILNDGAGAMLFHHRSQQQLHQPQQAPVANPQQSMQQPGQQSMNPDDEVGPLRIRNLEDLIRQLEHHSSRHMSPTASEDINNSYGMSETEADRHYRLESSAACSESSHGSRCRQRSSDDENRFMSYGRYQQRSNRHQHHQPNSPHSFNHIHHSHAHLSSHGHSSHHSSHTHLHQDEEGIYESADPRERNAIDLRDANDSESDDFIQAQQQLARWASEDVVSVVVMESDSSAVVPSPVTVTQNIIPHLSTQMPQPTPLIINGLGVGVSRTDYYPSPPSTTETESSGSVMLTQRRGIDVSGGPHQENTGRYPEYKH